MRLRALIACLALSGALGCWVMDEVDSSAALMKKPGGTPPSGAAQDAPDTAPAPSGPSWWETAVSLGSEELDDEIVRCELRGRSAEFMPRPDCLTRGGTPVEPRG